MGSRHRTRTSLLGSNTPPLSRRLRLCIRCRRRRPAQTARLHTHPRRTGHPPCRRWHRRRSLLQASECNRRPCRNHPSCKDFRHHTACRPPRNRPPSSDPLACRGHHRHKLLNRWRSTRSAKRAQCKPRRGCRAWAPSSPRRCRRCHTDPTRKSASRRWFPGSASPPHRPSLSLHLRRPLVVRQERCLSLPAGCPTSNRRRPTRAPGPERTTRSAGDCWESEKISREPHSAGIRSQERRSDDR
jgi:hypothetical protein